jgi:hypothetical protein
MAKDKKTEREITREGSPAAAIREEIEKLTGRRSDRVKGRERSPPQGQPEEGPQPKSPREFIQERMRELDQKKHD